MKDPCSSISKLLERYFDKEATPQEKSLVEGHLLDCQTCQDTLRSMDEIKNLIKNPVEEVVQKEDFPWVWEKVQRGIQQKERSPWWKSLQTWFYFSPFSQKKVWMPIAAAMVIFILVTTQQLYRKPPSYPNPSVVLYTESRTHNVMVYESEKGMVTVIWLFEGPEEESPTS
jgi:hypothetical protein